MITQNYRPQLGTYSTPIGSGATYVDSSYNIEYFKNVTHRVFADQGGTFIIEQSDDATTWDQVSSTAVAANTPLFVNTQAYLKFIRCRLVNGAAAQTVVRLSAYGSAN